MVSKRREKVIAVIGGGRWGRVYLSVLAKLLLSKDKPFNQVVIVSKYNSEKINRTITSLQTSMESESSTTILPFSIVSSLEDLVIQYNVQAAIVVNAAQEHFETTAYLLEHQIPTLVEKPLALSSEQAKILLNRAMNKGICLIPGLQLRFCSYLHNFLKYKTNILEQPQSFLIEWLDSANEIRYNEAKTFDHSINLAQDMMPHIWTILSMVFQNPKADIISCGMEERDHITYAVSLEPNIQGKILLSRNAEARKRKISIEYPNNQPLVLDFTSEPGTITLNQKTFSADPEWSEDSRPLAKQLRYFFSAINKGPISTEDAEACLQSVTFTEQASLLFTKKF